MKAMIGIPQPYPLTIPPTGWLVMDGQVINATKYPILASIYGANLPDLRGMFIRGWDNGKGIDSGRALLSNQNQLVGSHTHPGGLPASIGTTWLQHHQLYTGGWSEKTPGDPNNRHTGTNTTLTDNRPKNIAFNYICYGG